MILISIKIKYSQKVVCLYNVFVYNSIISKNNVNILDIFSISKESYRVNMLIYNFYLLKLVLFFHIILRICC